MIIVEIPTSALGWIAPPIKQNNTFLYRLYVGDGRKFASSSLVEVSEATVGELCWGPMLPSGSS